MRKTSLSALPCLLLMFYMGTFSSGYAVRTTVTSSANSGSGTLRDALSQVFISPGLDTIVFDIAGPAPHTITLTSSLPSTFGNWTVIDGNTQPGYGYTGDGKKIVIQTSSVATFMSGNYTRGLEIRGFTRGFTASFSADSMVVEQCRIMNCSYGICPDQSECRVTQCQIEDCSWGIHGIRGICTVDQTRIANCSWGITQSDGFLEVDHSRIDTTSWGIFISGTIRSEIQNTVVDSSTACFSVNGSGSSNDTVILTDSRALRASRAMDFNGDIDCIVMERDTAELSGIGILSFLSGGFWEMKASVVRNNDGNGIDMSGQNHTFVGRNNQLIDNDGYGINCAGGPVQFQSDRGRFSGNGRSGINLSTFQPWIMTIDSAFIGVDANGTAPHPNADFGITNLSGNDLITISNSVISANGRWGIENGFGGAYMTLVGNFIGTDRTGLLPLGNQDGGIRFSLGANGRIGGSGFREGNTIAFNNGDGIENMSDRILISENAIYCNTGKGINLRFSGNANYPAPSIVSHTAFSVTGTAQPNSIVEVFQNDTCSCGSQGQGEIYLGTATANGSGNWTYFGIVPSPIYLTATATHPTDSNTSEFSPAICPPPLGMNQLVLRGRLRGRDTVELAWEMTTPIPYYSFVIERAFQQGDIDQGIFVQLSFMEIGRLEGEESETFFVFSDQLPGGGYYTYRIRSQSGDGEEVVSTKLSFQGIGRVPKVQGFPNPTQDLLHLLYPPELVAGAGNLKIVDPYGRTVFQNDFQVLPSELDLGKLGLTSGNYSLLLQGEDWARTHILRFLFY